jgi:hypothetical protein
MSTTAVASMSTTVTAAAVVAAAMTTAARATAIAVAAVVAAVTAVDVTAIVAATAAVEAIAAPTVTVAPIGPGAYAKEDAVVEVAGTIVAVGSAGVGRVVIVAPGTDGWGTTYNNADLRTADGYANPDLRASRCRHERQTA